MGGHCHPLAYCFIKKLLKGIRRSLYLPQQTELFVGNSVKVRSLSGAIKFAGEMTSYDKTHGTITPEFLTYCVVRVGSVGGVGGNAAFIDVMCSYSIPPLSPHTPHTPPTLTSHL